MKNSRRVFSVVVFLMSALTSESWAQNCDQNIAGRMAAARSGNLGLLYQIDAAYQNCLRNLGRPRIVPQVNSSPPPDPTKAARDEAEQTRLRAEQELQNAIKRAEDKLAASEKLAKDMALSAGLGGSNASAPAGYSDIFLASSLGSKIMSGAPLPGNIPLSNGTVMQQVIKVPSGYSDPFAAKAPTVYTSVGNGQSVGPNVGKPSGSIWDPSQQSQMQPQSQPATQPTKTLGPNTNYPTSAPCTGFNAPGSNVSPCGN